jgi:hypothetical protein
MREFRRVSLPALVIETGCTEVTVEEGVLETRRQSVVCI